MAEERSILREYLEAFIIAAIFLIFTQNWVIQTFYIPSGSMEDTLLIGDHLFVNRFIYGSTAFEIGRKTLPFRSVERGDIVVFRSPENPKLDLVKRCVAVGGDTVRIIDGQLFINGQAANDSSYAVHKNPDNDLGVYGDPRVQLRDNYGPYVVPAGHYFCMGDNRDNSNDSRYWGPVPESYLKGRAFMVYWSFESDEVYLDTPDYGDRMRQIGRVALNFFTRTRWDRTFRIVR